MEKENGDDKMSKFWKYLFSYIIALILVLTAFIGVSEVYVTIHKWIFSDSNISIVKISQIMAIVVMVLIATIALAKEIRAHPGVVSIGTTNISNFMYHPDFEKQYDSIILKENKQLKTKINEQEQYSDELLDELETKDLELEQVAYISDIFIRHHKNASRLVRSLLQLLNEGSLHWKWEFCNNILDECVTILLEDRADKSSTIYFINGDNKLEMFAYNRIEFSSSRRRMFKKGEGFAGHIWEMGETELVSDVLNSPYFEGEYAPRHEYGSILGVPIKIGAKVARVLCIQSEDIDEFHKDDERTVIFYADMCALAHFYDKLKNR